MTRTLAENCVVYRIGDPKGTWPIYSPEGARRTAGRWNDVGDAVIYTTANYSTAMLEKLVYSSGILPPNQHYIQITIPSGTSYEVFSEAHTPNWHAKNKRAARKFGHQWHKDRRSALLFVPSVVARMERNVLINHDHPEASSIIAGLEQPVWWDKRLF